MNEQYPSGFVFNPHPSSEVPQTLRYGKTEVHPMDATKSMRKAKRKLDDMAMKGVLQQSVSVADAGIVHSKNGDVYPRLEIAGHKPWHIRPDIFSTHSGNVVHNLCVVTGSCLYGEQHAQGITNTGRSISLVNKKHTTSLQSDEHITEIKTVSGLQAYEIDTIARISRTMKIIGNDTTQISAGIHIPEVEYWLYLFDLHEKGQMSSDLLQCWCHDVSNRASYLSEVFAKRLQKNSSASVFRFDPFQSVSEYTAQTLSHGSMPSLAEMSEMLAEGSSVWETQLMKNTPQNYTDLSNMANVIMYVTQLETHEAVLGVENPEEAQILSHTAQSVELSDGQFFGGLYVHPQVFIADEGLISSVEGEDPLYDLYYLNTITGLPVAKSIMQANS